MNEPKRRVLLIGAGEDTALAAGELQRCEPSLDLCFAMSPSELAHALETPPEVVILASGTPELEFSAAQTLWRSRGLSPACIVLSREYDSEELTRVMNGGAVDYVSRDRITRLVPALRRELARATARKPAADSRGPHGLCEAIVNELPFVLFAKDEELRLRMVNERALTLAGKTREQMMGLLDHEYLPKEQADLFMADDLEVLASGREKVVEEQVTPAGVPLWFRTRKVAVTDAEGKRYVVGITEDITLEREAREALRRSKAELEANLVELKKTRAVSARTLASYQQRALQMEIIRQQNEDLDRLAQDLSHAKKLEEERAREIESAARLKSEFLANFSHEIRTPLNGILGYCELLMREEGSRLTPHGRRDLNVVKANAKTLLALINDILDLSKIEAGHVDVVRETTELRPLVEECIATVRDYLQGKQVEVYANIPSGLESIQTDPLKLKQILLNLLSNAAKFTDAGEIVVDVQRDGATLLLSVEDTGSGIPADQLPFVFEKFRQVDGSSTRKVGGTGLGLAIVHELCRVLGGRVTVSSTLGRGSVFRVRLEQVLVDPGVADTTVQTLRSSDRFEIAPGTSVLVVDDDPLIHQLLKLELEREGICVLLAGDGVEALSVARERLPSAIVLDMYLPKLDGWAVLAELKSDVELSRIPVIIISVEEQRARGYSLGACEYLVKPFEAARLLDAVGRSVGTDHGEVLVVDDDAATRELVCRELRAAGFSTSEARSGEDALVRARVTHPALIVLDLVMPGLNGFEVLTQLRREQISAPVLVLTGKSLSPSEERWLRDGMAAVVEKNGVSIEKIIAEAKRLLIARRDASQAKLPRVLYVEDSAQNRDVVRRYLAGLFEVLEAEDGEHGLDRARRELPDLILMDLSLPRLDGWEATRRLKAGPQAGIPVVALTAHASREDQARALSAGCDGYLTKPVDRDVLIATINAHLQKRLARPSELPRPTPSPT